MPVLNLAIPNIALMIRLTAAGAAEARSQDYVKYARAKGVGSRRIVRRHILRNILSPIVTMLGMEFGSLLAFSTITETVFAWPGMGKLLITSIYQLDRPVIVSYVHAGDLHLRHDQLAGRLRLCRARSAGEAGWSAWRDRRPPCRKPSPAPAADRHARAPGDPRRAEAPPDGSAAR